jgi:bifunctional DNA-binding transcriptional regulator/antitoxin component of YhaV-PrlF toxin-antitoxin module
MLKSKVITISSQGQVTIPKQWRDQWGSKQSGQNNKIVALLEEEDGLQQIRLLKFSKNLTDRLENSSQGAYGRNTQEIKQYLQQEKDSWP